MFIQCLHVAMQYLCVDGCLCNSLVLCILWVFMNCPGVDAMFGCLWNVRVFVKWLGVNAFFRLFCYARVFMQCLHVDAMLGGLCNI